MVVFLALSACLLAALPSPAGEAGTVAIALRTEATAKGPQVTVGDIADLQGGNSEDRERIARLDLAELPLSRKPLMLSRQQIDFRLQLAGFAAYRLEGPRFVHVSRPAGEGLEDKIAEVARKALERKLGDQVEDVRIELAQAVSLPPLSADGDEIHLEAESRGAIVPPCRVAVEVGIYVRGARRNSVLAYLDVKKLQPIPVAVRRIEIGEAFNAENVHLERVAVDNRRRSVAAEGLMGRHARRVVSAGHPLEQEDIEPNMPAALVVHVSDLVHLIATVGPLQVKTRGEAMQAGRIGQLIQVRNLESKATVTGRVLDRSTVQVEY